MCAPAERHTTSRFAAARTQAVAQALMQMELEQVAIGGVGTLPGEGRRWVVTTRTSSNAAFRITPSSVVVIDALARQAGTTAHDGDLQEDGIADQPCDRHHYHADHIYGLQAFKAAGARIVAHSRAR
ncbi:MAG: hypothetical protein U1F00_02360 [Rhodoferax sp.]